MILYIYQYFDYYEMFDAIDRDDDRRVEFNEFERAIPLLEKWGVKVANAKNSFKEIDR